MPAHIGFGDVLRTGLSFLVANLSQSRKSRNMRRMRKRRNGTGIISPALLWEGVERDRDRREHRYQSYDPFRAYLDTYDPDQEVDRERLNDRTVDRTEWELYLQPGTEFDQVCEQYFVDYPDGEIIAVNHKKQVQHLKRIETKRQGHRTRIIWSEA
ncbi:MAG TPA: hypothetical protein VGG99_17505 [Acetobacteraceae bacterium]